MHDTAHTHGQHFFALYWQPHFKNVVELGSQNINGSLRDHAPASASYLGLDTAPGAGVDRVVVPGATLPLPDGCADVVVTSSALEHDPCFWETFLEMVRLLRPGGLLYINAPSNHAFHRHPVDCWRFYPDAGTALVAWAHRRGAEVELVESFVAKPAAQGWSDFVAIFRRPGPPLLRRGRLADLGETQNSFDIEAVGLQHERPDTFDMRALANARQQLQACERERDELRVRADRTGSELRKAYEAILALKQESEALRQQLLSVQPASGRTGTR
ncbi:methyltransferase domain-containing protein [Variovorax sp. EL159]|uniref:methyltransferase domain-containing protein n=1 Tax=Variovorax sp. EL159 TaxID=1566270 RepID=UPI000881B5C3|nr:methyltransferase domain-containing protein [Variovorax sp. EL159]SCX59335.1 Methyltransferase domain-containing protein [Variovorax sp. EL159]